MEVNIKDKEFDYTGMVYLQNFTRFPTIHKVFKGLTIFFISLIMFLIVTGEFEFKLIKENFLQIALYAFAYNRVKRRDTVKVANTNVKFNEESFTVINDRFDRVFYVGNVVETTSFKYDKVERIRYSEEKNCIQIIGYPNAEIKYLKKNKIDSKNSEKINQLGTILLFVTVENKDEIMSLIQKHTNKEIEVLGEERETTGEITKAKEEVEGKKLNNIDEKSSINHEENILKTFSVDMELKENMYKEQVSKSPIWKRKRWTLAILILGALICTGYVIVLYDDVLVKIVAGIIIFLITMMPGMAYFNYLITKCSDRFYQRTGDYMVIKEHSISHMYHEKSAMLETRYIQEEVNYDSIKRIVYNKYHNRIDVFGQRYYTICDDLRNPEWEKLKRRDSKPNRSRFYLFYENNEEILDMLKEKTGIEFEVINYPEI